MRGATEPCSLTINVSVNSNRLDVFFNTIKSVVKGQEHNVKLLLAGFFSRGHVLLEGIPGTGKTTLSLAFSKLLGLEFKRIQGTGDMLPADITGAFVPQKNDGKLVFLKGPIFTDVLLVDEINRMNPRTQSALLEAMEERQVTVEGKTYALSSLFFVIATQNPSESYGTFPLPASQLDRFMMRIQINRVSEDVERKILRDEHLRDKIKDLEAIFKREEVYRMINDAGRVKIGAEIEDYLIFLARAIRSHPVFLDELSTRALLHLRDAARAFAYIEGRDYVIPFDVKNVLEPVILHRIGLHLTYQDKKKLLDEIKESVEPPI